MSTGRTTTGSALVSARSLLRGKIAPNLVGRSVTASMATTYAETMK
ncbi:hypothetical protein GCM10010178_86830 [Lentzea flava]|uniref:Uncharacterized protein n=1 Tax=Lentzea flava TaxID=103732 RepID=A0ABQ2VEH7_9PSEU|nr:hypothetical protein GCM10010178_86830 [Lentzea flava]